MQKIEDLYFVNKQKDNIVYSLDMLRLKTYIDFSKYNDLEFWLRTYHGEQVKSWIGKSIKEFHYNFRIEVEEGKSIYVGFQHNNEKNVEKKSSYYDNGLYNLTIEFNPNKLKLNRILLRILDMSADWYLKSYDLAFDIAISINDLIWDMSRKRNREDRKPWL